MNLRRYAALPGFLPVPTASGGTDGPDPGADTPNEHIGHIRAQLMHGFGTGADQRTVTALTSDRRELGGRPTVVGLEPIAGQAVRARGDTSPLLERILRAARKATFVLGVAVIVAAGLASILRQQHHIR